MMAMCVCVWTIDSKIFVMATGAMDVKFEKKKKNEKTNQHSTTIIQHYNHKMNL